MPDHKLTHEIQQAIKKVQVFLQQHPKLHATARIAVADGIVAISGSQKFSDDHLAFKFAREAYGVDLKSPSLLADLRVMAAGYHFEKREGWEVDNCAESHLWMTLFALHRSYAIEKQAPRHRHHHPKLLHIAVCELDRKNRGKQDSPCQNCRQWVRKEFLTVNGTK